MTGIRAYIAGMGAITPAGRGVIRLQTLLENSATAIGMPDLFPISPDQLLPAGRILDFFENDQIPRTHQLALAAADEAMAGSQGMVDAVIIGVTTGGILTTEEHLKKEIDDPEKYAYHGAGTVAEYLAEKYRCKGQVITVSNACSSGAAAIKLAMEMIRCGAAGHVLAGGADSLCRLTYYGFKSLQLVDRTGAHPFDKNRRGMSVGEAAAMVYLVSDENKPDNAVAEVLGGGLSCDAYHPTTPDPDGKGAIRAMKAAISDANITASDIDYINLHGTGTIDNDLCEAKAVKALFSDNMPFLSSVKGALGHSLAASGAVEAVVCAMSVSQGLIPANTGLIEADPESDIEPLKKPVRAKVKAALSNSFGFGGNNASIILGDCQRDRAVVPKKLAPLAIVGCACITGAGDMKKTLEHLISGRDCKGLLCQTDISGSLDPSLVRRLKRLPRMALALAKAAVEDSGQPEKPSSIFWGTGWGPLSETYDFLNKLYESDEKFPSPTDFIGSVHNAPAGQAAIHFKATGPNVTTTGGDFSFEQALFAANLMADDITGPFLVMGADEYHHKFSPLFDRSVAMEKVRSDGGGAICLVRSKKKDNPAVVPAFFGNADQDPDIISSLVEKLGGRKIDKCFGGILAGIPAAYRNRGERQLKLFLELTDCRCPVIDYRRSIGEFASASAVAVALATVFKRMGEIPESLSGRADRSLDEKGVLVLGFGKFVTAITIT
ncbi:MAG: beta-ketoacyl-[acyl-carrier-protein] synthase family protein [Desulfobacterales bacterium]|nr:beta-ketoacyl-[acyl-carrier-protein] synthase family protein [Desulfobacterales bacterium]